MSGASSRTLPVSTQRLSIVFRSVRIEYSNYTLSRWSLRKMKYLVIISYASETAFRSQKFLGRRNCLGDFAPMPPMPKQNPNHHPSHHPLSPHVQAELQMQTKMSNVPTCTTMCAVRAFYAGGGTRHMNFVCAFWVLGRCASIRRP